MNNNGRDYNSWIYLTLLALVSAIIIAEGSLLVPLMIVAALVWAIRAVTRR